MLRDRREESFWGLAFAGTFSSQTVFSLSQCSKCVALSYPLLYVLLLQLGPKAEDVEEPVNLLAFLFRFSIGTICASYYVLVPVYMWIKDQVVPKGQPI
jgi:hypothetical protein